jgi:quercetin dioxygenase-like cupin family protein
MSMKKQIILCTLLASIGTAHAAASTQLIAHDLIGLAGKESQITKVTVAPGQVGVPHRHNANVFVYILSGTMQVKGGKLTTLHAGDTYYESPSDIHVVSNNASKTEPAEFLAFFVKDKGAPSTTPVK